MLQYYLVATHMRSHKSFCNLLLRFSLFSSLRIPLVLLLTNTKRSFLLRSMFFNLVPSYKPNQIRDFLCTFYVLDASWYMPDEQRNPLQEYQVAHIPGALFFDVDGILDRATNVGPITFQTKFQPHLVWTLEQALYHAPPMDYVTVGKLQSKMDGEANQTIVNQA